VIERLGHPPYLTPVAVNNFGGHDWGVFWNGVLHGVRQPGQSFSQCVNQNANETTGGAVNKVSSAAVGAYTGTLAFLGALSQIPSPWAGSAQNIANYVGSQTGNTANPITLSLAGTLAGFAARSLGAGFGATRTAIQWASGAAAGAGEAAVAITGGIAGLTIGSAINCR
jgi:hypothetical protein